jgi:hypothetical protein
VGGAKRKACGGGVWGPAVGAGGKRGALAEKGGGLVATAVPTTLLA